MGLSPRVRGNLSWASCGGYSVRSIPACAGEPRYETAVIRCTSVYPRVCGGTSGRRRAAPVHSGLSPRVRGNRPSCSLASVVMRSIPACAGEPNRVYPVVRPAGVYPRVCGGTENRRFTWRIDEGLSPRVRGNLLEGPAVNDYAGSIPACAGEPLVKGFRNARITVYPRVCGGTIFDEKGKRAWLGLSPRVRGNQLLGQGYSAGEGSIPACAGEPLPHLRPIPRPWVHPRVCGGTANLLGVWSAAAGPSPRVRGNPLSSSESEGSPRSIPACAGEPGHLVTAQRSSQVHPRVCGGTPLVHGRGLSRRGPSPRVRGNREALRPAGVPHGSIPACAGEPATGRRAPTITSVHPRVCGGTDVHLATSVASLGPSPRVRGNPHAWPTGAGEYGSIPACAGEPLALAASAGLMLVHPRVCRGT